MELSAKNELSARFQPFECHLNSSSPQIWPKTCDPNQDLDYENAYNIAFKDPLLYGSSDSRQYCDQYCAELVSNQSDSHTFDTEIETADYYHFDNSCDYLSINQFFGDQLLETESSLNSMNSCADDVFNELCAESGPNKRGRRSLKAMGFTDEEIAARIRDQNRRSQKRVRDRRKEERSLAFISESSGVDKRFDRKRKRRSGSELSDFKSGAQLFQ